jgi:monofunctional glycosyltransferase
MARVRAFVGLGVAALCVAGLLAFVALALLLSLPDPNKIKGCMTAEMHKVYLCDSSPNFAPFERISPYVIGAVIMSEDAAFFSHQGLDYDEIKESIKKDLSEYRFARGASTITQQLAKNVFLKSEKSVVRKLSEVYLALQIEKILSKRRILTLYLNVVEFGPNIYGIKQASRHYFKREPDELTPEQAAFLAFLLPNPKKYRQSFDKKQLTPFANKMVRTILRKMQLGRKITPEEYEAAVARVPLFPWDGSVTAPDPLQTYVGDDENIQDDPDVPDEEPSGTAPSMRKELEEEINQEENLDDNEFQYDFDPNEPESR